MTMLSKIVRQDENSILVAVCGKSGQTTKLEVIDRASGQSFLAANKYNKAWFSLDVMNELCDARAELFNVLKAYSTGKNLYFEQGFEGLIIKKGFEEVVVRISSIGLIVESSRQTLSQVKRYKWNEISQVLGHCIELIRSL